jgi:hypothetical protein
MLRPTFRAVKGTDVNNGELRSHGRMAKFFGWN